MKKLFLNILIMIFLACSGCDQNKGDDFSYGEYPDSKNTGTTDKDNVNIKKDGDTVNEKDDSDVENRGDFDTDFKDDIENYGDDDSFYNPDSDEKSDDSSDGQIENDGNNVNDENNINDSDSSSNDTSVINDSDIFVIIDEDSLNVPDEDSVVLPDEDTVVYPDVDIIYEPECGNSVVEQGEVCERDHTFPCNMIDPDNYASGWADCLYDCSGWIFTKCEEYPCHLKPDAPDPDFTDSNCDGIDGDIEESVFVDLINGMPTNNGTMSSPVSTITKGIQIAENTGKKHVLVAEGNYYENLVLKSGISIHGAYSGYPNWKRNVGNVTTINVNASGVTGNSISNTVLSFLTVKSADASSSGSSKGVVLTNSSNITLSNVKIIAGKGGDGANGVAGVSGGEGNDGVKGEIGCEDSGGVFCSNCDQPQGGAGGTSACGMKGGKGGLPGKGNSNGYSGENGVGSDDNGGPGDIAGNWTEMCIPDVNFAANGKNGNTGTYGINGEPGESLGGITSTSYQPADGGDGTDGEHGQGGGGGGGGCGGAYACNSYGSSGGGGGGGGCKGTGGTGGKGGGGSFGLWLYKCDKIILQNARLESKDGGKGGDGAHGGDGGLGGLGAFGGDYGGDGEQNDGGCGGMGGNGGAGGQGGHGGGGGGGPSFPMVKIESQVEGISETTFIFNQGGNGGYSAVNPGYKGLAGQYYEN